MIAADLDPQANLTSRSLSEERLDEIWEVFNDLPYTGQSHRSFVALATSGPRPVEQIDQEIGLLVGDLELSRFEDDLSAAWPKCQLGDERSCRVMSAFARAIAMGGEHIPGRGGAGRRGAKSRPTQPCRSAGL